MKHNWFACYVTHFRNSRIESKQFCAHHVEELVQVVFGAVDLDLSPSLLALGFWVEIRDLPLDLVYLTVSETIKI